MNNTRDTSIMALLGAAQALSGSLLAIHPAYLEQNAPSFQSVPGFQAVGTPARQLVAARPTRLRRYDPSETLYVMDGSVAVIDVYGAMARGDSYMSYYYGGTSTEYLRAAIAQAGEDAAVRGILFRINSPGGEIDGIEATTEDLITLGTKKPTVALIEGMACSAAYWFACQCKAVYAEGATGEIGNIGIMATLSDMSKMYQEAGIKRILIGSDPLKGMGTPGTVVTKDMEAALQAIVDSLYAQFVSVVSGARKLTSEAVRALGSRVYVGLDAQAAGLIDGIASYQSVVDALQQSAASAGGKLVIRPASGTTTRGRQAQSSPAPIQEKPIMREKIAAAFLKVGLVTMATAIMGASSDDPDILAATLSGQVSTESQEQLKKHPLLAALSAANITTVEAFQTLQKNAGYGASYVAALREDAKAQAIVAFGVETTEGKAHVDAANTMIEGASPEVLTSMTAQYEGLAKQKGLQTANGQPAARQTAARQLPNAAVDATQQAQGQAPTFDMDAIMSKYGTYGAAQK